MISGRDVTFIISVLIAATIACGEAYPSGPDTGRLPPTVQSEPQFLWSSGYENSPWDAEWGLKFFQLDRHDIVSRDVFAGDHSARVTYPKGPGPGTYSSAGGAQYQTDFSLLNDSLSGADELYLRYYVKFGDGFDFVRGGKLPGLYGGRGNNGGDRPDGFDGWSARIMWLADGRIVQYVYNPDQPNRYGEVMDWNVGGSSRHFEPGTWHCVETYIKLNTVHGEGAETADHDGIVRSWLDGELALDRTDVRFRFTERLHINGVHFSTFFGGDNDSWSATKVETAMFDNFAVHDAPIGLYDRSSIPPHPGPALHPPVSSR